MPKINFINSDDIPLEINSPIKKAIVEIRFESTLPPEAVYGFVFNQLSNSPELIEKGVLFSPKEEIKKLPINDLPDEVRIKNSELKYQPYCRILSKDHHQCFYLGPNVCAFEIHAPYLGWSEWEKFFIPILQFLISKKIISSITRISNRCIDEIEDCEIKNGLNFQVSVTGNTFTEGFFFNTKIDVDGIDCILSIVVSESNSFIVDIDCISEKNIKVEEFSENLNSFLKLPHEKNKKVFFSLINEKYLKEKLEPKYE